jgi:hypothetical protein
MQEVQTTAAAVMGGGRDTMPPTVRTPMFAEMRVERMLARALAELVTADLELDARSEEYLGTHAPAPFAARRLRVSPAPKNSRPAKARPAEARPGAYAVLSQDVADELDEAPPTLRQPCVIS